jgi:transcription elongation factor/antiterminator RfaH
MRTDSNHLDEFDRAPAGGPRWFAVHSLPHREARAQQQLENQGFHTFLPRYLKARRHARKVENVLAPIFPRYLFVVLDLDRDRWRSVNGTFGVARLVIMAGDRPQPAPHGVVEALIALADGRDVLRFDEGDRLAVGQRVRILAGPFAEQIGLLQRLDDNGRVRLLLDIMGGRIAVTVPSAALVPVS